MLKETNTMYTNLLSSRNGILGFAIGDAMGVPNEFCTREELMENPVTEMIGYKSHNVPKGCWSDDTSLTLATMDSIIEKKKIDTEDMATKFLEWLKEAKYTPTSNVFDVGGTTFKALARFEAHLRPAAECGGVGDMDNGNGSLMRMLPIAYFVYFKNLQEEKIFDVVKKVSGITHKHAISVMGCFIYVLFVNELLKKKTKEEAYEKIQNVDYSKYFLDEIIEKYDRILKGHIAALSLDKIKSSGYVVHTLEAILWILFNTYNFNSTIIGAINLGDDTDTIGACVGGMAGILYTLKDVNPRWEKDLIKYEAIKEMCVKFDEACNQ